jgi:hypothetical protein
MPLFLDFFSQNLIMETIFIYSKDGKIKVLNFETSKILHDEMRGKGWCHVHTINPCIFIEYLFEKSDNEIVNSIRSLNTPSV